MANYVYITEQRDKIRQCDVRTYISSLKKVKEKFRGFINKNAQTNRLNSCRGVTGLIYHGESDTQKLRIYKIKPL